MKRPSRRLGPLVTVLVLMVAPRLRAQETTLQPPTAEAPATLTVQGHVVDSETGDPIHMAEVWLVESKQHAMTDREGRFVFRDVVAGVHTLRITRLGYEMLLEPEVRLEEGASPDLVLRMTRKDLRLKTITVTPGAYAIMNANPATRQTLSREDIATMPQLGEDVFRAINRLPGLTSTDYAAHFSIRGGRHDETLILLDGLELYEPYHLKDFNEGALSIIDVETVEGVQLLTGGFPAQYGNKRSGVFDITSRSVEKDETRYSVGLSLLNARAMARGPLGKDKGAWLLSARSGYMDLVFGLIHQNQLPSPRYQDVFGKLEYPLSPKHKLTFDVLYAGDTYKFDAPSTTGFLDSLETRENAKNSYSNSYVWSTVNSVLAEKTAVRTMVSAGLVTRNRDGYERYVFNTAPLYTLTDDRRFSVFGFKQDWTQGIIDIDMLSFGVDVRRFDMTDTFTSVVGEDPNDPTADSTAVYPVRTETHTHTTGTRLGVYASNRLALGKRLIVEAGGRFDRATWTGDADWSPRTSAALDLGGRRTLRLGWGYYRQMQGIDEVAALNNDNRYFPSELSEQWTAGLEQVFADDAVLRLEAYYKRGSHLRPVYRNWKGGVDTFPETNEDRILVFPRSSTSKGIELYYDRKLGRKFNTRASYAYSIADEELDRVESINTAWTIPFDREHSNPQDQRHALNADLTYRPHSKWSLTTSVAFHSGWPATLEHLEPVVDAEGDPETAVRPIKLYAERLPSYLRLDLRATRHWQTQHGEWRLFLELVNFTNHANVFGYDYFRTRDAFGNIVLDREDETWFSVLPSAGVFYTATF